MTFTLFEKKLDLTFYLCVKVPPHTHREKVQMYTKQVSKCLCVRVSLFGFLLTSFPNWDRHIFPSYIFDVQVNNNKWKILAKGKLYKIEAEYELTGFFFSFVFKTITDYLFLYSILFGLIFFFSYNRSTFHLWLRLGWCKTNVWQIYNSQLLASVLCFIENVFVKAGTF